MVELPYKVAEHENGKEYFVKDADGVKVGYGLFSYTNKARAEDLATLLNKTHVIGMMAGIKQTMEIMDNVTNES